MSRDLPLLLVARVLRAFGFGFSAILVAIHLQARGFSATAIGLVLALSLLMASFTGLASAVVSSRVGRRTTLAVIGLLMALCGVDLATAHEPGLLVLAGLTGMMGVSGTDLGPFLAIEQALLAQSATEAGRNQAFARYSYTGALAGAAGALAAGLATNIRLTSLYFAGFAVIGLVTAIIPIFLSADIDSAPTTSTFGGSRSLIGLSALFGMDSLGTGMVVNAVAVYWLHVKFGAGPGVLGPVFALMSVLAAVSQAFAGSLADRIGLINTMVFTHLPSSLLLIAVPFMPNLQLALAVLVVRSALASMDQPARQAYVVSIVKPGERAGALAITGAVRGLALSAGPLITGAAIQAAVSGLPFVAGGLVKSVYDVGLYVGYRRRFGDHERRDLRPGTSAPPKP